MGNNNLNMSEIKDAMRYGTRIARFDRTDSLDYTDTIFIYENDDHNKIYYIHMQKGEIINYTIQNKSEVNIYA